MGITDWFNEQMYILFSMYYYEVFLYQNKIQVGRIIQPVSYNPNFIVDFNRKLAFLIVSDRCFVKGHKLILHYNIDFGIPLKETEDNIIEEISENITKTTKVIKLSANITKEEKEKAKPKNIVKEEKTSSKTITENNLSPSLIFEIFNAHFVVKTLQKPKSTDWGIVIIAVLIGIVLLGGMAIMIFGLK